MVAIVTANDLDNVTIDILVDKIRANPLGVANAIVNDPAAAAAIGMLGIGYVPVNKAGDTMTGGLDTPNVSADYFKLDTAATPPATPLQGTIWWNGPRGVPSFTLLGGNVNLELGEGGQLCFNGESTPIVDGEAVYLDSAQGYLPKVKRASNATEMLSSRTLGVATETLPVGGTGWITTEGIINKLQLGMYQEGTVLWLGSTPGTVTDIKPEAPSHVVFIGIVTRANNGNGSLYVRPQNGYELDELHNVKITDPLTNNMLRLTSAGVWVNIPGPAGAVVGDTDVQVLSNKEIVPRVVSINDADVIVANVDTSDVVTQINTLPSNPLSISVTGTPVDGQKLTIRMRNANTHTLSWSASFGGSTDLPLPTATTGSNKWDYAEFVYNSSSAKFHLMRKVFGL